MPADPGGFCFDSCFHAFQKLKLRLWNVGLLFRQAFAEPISVRVAVTATDDDLVWSAFARFTGLFGGVT